MSGHAFSLAALTLSISCILLARESSCEDRARQDEPAEKSAANSDFDKKLERLRHDLKSRSAAERIRAAEAIGALGRDAEQAIGDLCTALVDRTPDVRQAASEALEKVNPEFREVVFPIAAEGNRHNRIEYLKKLSQGGDENKAALPVVLYRLDAAINEGGSAWVESEVCFKVLAVIANGDKDAQEAVIKVATKGPTERYRGQALACLSQMEIKDTKRVVAILVNAVRTDSDRNKALAIKGLGELGHSAKSAIDTLRKAKGNSTAAVRNAAAEAIAKIENDKPANGETTEK